MGLLPSWLDNCGSNMFSIYEDAEDAILADMARRIATYDYYIPAAEYQRQVLEQMGATQQYILSELSRRTGKTQSELKQLMQEAGIEAVRSDADIYRRHGKAVPDQASEVMQNILAAGYQQTAGAFDNLCRTTARAGTNQFLRELNTAWLMVSGGGMSLDQATTAAIKRLAASGLDAVSYASGRKLSLDAAVRMTVRTGINQTAAKLQLQFAAEMDSDLVEVTAHAGARPSHAEWQGKVYSISGKTKGYRKLEDATGYGTVDGLCGANCRHNMFPFFEGESGAYSKRELEEYTRSDAVTYNGKSMSLYEAQQLQRYQERQIRRWKRENVAMQAAGLDTAESAVKLRSWQEQQKDFLKQTGLKPQSAREQVASFGRSQARRATSEFKTVENKANQLYNLGNTKNNIAAYLKHKPVHDELETHGIRFIQWISDKEVIVDAGKPKIKGETKHAADNRVLKSDRTGMTIERAQSFVDNAKIIIYQPDRKNLKFLAQDGYAILNLDNVLVTAVPQKWRNKYNKYLEGLK